MGDAFYARHPILTFFALAGVIILILAVVAQFAVQGSFFEDVSCEYRQVTEGNQTYSSLSTFKTAVEEHNGNWTAIDSQVTFRVRDDTLEYRLKPDECAELQQVNPA